MNRHHLWNWRNINSWFSPKTSPYVWNNCTMYNDVKHVRLLLLKLKGHYIISFTQIWGKAHRDLEWPLPTMCHFNWNWISPVVSSLRVFENIEGVWILKLGMIYLQELSALTYFMMGALAKVAATFVTYPLQVIQSKLRVRNFYWLSRFIAWNYISFQKPWKQMEPWIIIHQKTLINNYMWICFVRTSIIVQAWDNSFFIIFVWTYKNYEDILPITSCVLLLLYKRTSVQSVLGILVSWLVVSR